MARVATGMAEALVHRGPDDLGTWTDASSGVAFGFRRLAVLDLTPLGHQPMVSESGRYVVVFNGEVYNFRELRRELESRGHQFRGGSDTEVILAAAQEWGLENALCRFNGMFALALWDHQTKSLALARDRLGIKPVYFGWAGDTLLFGSELTALRAHPEFRPEVDRGALTLYVRYGYVPAPFAIYRDTFKLEPGCAITFRSPRERAVPKPYWSLRDVAERGISNPVKTGEEEALEELHSLLADSVKRQMIADVPLGAFLSGGIDSSLIVALMQAQSVSAVRTFCIGFEEDGFDEAPHARAIAKHLGTDHTTMVVTPVEARSLIPQLPEIYCEPFGDSSAIPTSLLARLTRRRVTVSLSGDGGDELFGGYSQHWYLPKIWRNVNRVPGCLRGTLAKGMGVLGHYLSKSRLPIADRVSRALSFRALHFAAANSDAFMQLRFRRWYPAELVVSGGYQPPFWLHKAGCGPLIEPLEHRVMFVDTALGLPDDMLTKVDRATSAASLEARVPLLDHRIVEFSWRLPLRLKVRSEAQTKWVLRSLLRRYVPAALFERRKQGFGVPIARWLRGPLRDWGESLLDEARLRREGFLDPARVRRQWHRLLAGTYDWESEIWVVLMFQAWHERWMK